MGIFSTIKKWLTGGSTNSKIKSANRTSYYGGGVSSKRTQTQIKQSISAAKKKQEEEQKEKQEQLNSAFKASTYKAKTIAETRGKSEEKKAEKPDVFNKKNAYKATPPSTRRSTALGGLSESDIKTRTAKKAAADANRKEQLRTAERLKPLIDEKYGKRKSGVPTYVKQGNYAADPDVAKYNVLKHPVATSATRGAVSGTTFGLSELAIQKAPKSKEAAEAERFYQANKSKGAEFAGEMAGSIAGFGLTGNLSKNAVSKVFPKATAKIGASATERLATNKFVLQAAEKEALKTFGKTFTEKELAQLARAKAAKIVAAVGEDMAINLTTGAVSDVTHALIDSKDPVEFAKNMAINAGMNVALGGLTTVAPELFRGSELQSSMKAMGDDAVGFGRDVARNMDNKSGGIKISNGDVPPKNGAIEKTLNDLADKVESNKPTKKIETIASGKNWRSGEDIAFWKDGNTLYVGNPNGDFKSFGKDLPENRIKAEDEFDYYNNTRQQKLREARGEKQAKSKATKPKAEERPRPDGVKKYTDKQLLDMKKNGKLNQLSHDEYTYYIYDRPENDPFFEKWDAIDSNGKTVKKKATKAEEPKAEQPKAEQAKTEEPKSEKSTKTLTKKQLESKKKRSDKRLKQIEEEIKKSPYASQYEQDALSAKYTKELEYRKKLDERIKEAEASADGTITVSKGKKKAAKEVDESNVTVTKGKEELVDEPSKPKKEKKKKQSKTETETKTEAKTETKAEVKAEEPKPSKKVTSLENKIRNSDEKINKFKKQIAEKKKEGASEKSIANLEAQRKAEMERRKGFKKELKELTGSSEVSKKVEPPKVEAKAETEIKTIGNKKVDSLENRVAYANDNIDKFKKTLKEKKANGASEKSIAYTEKQLAKEKARLKEIKKELTAAKKEAEAKASTVDVEKLFKEQEKERYAVAGKSTKELKKQLADLQDDLKVLSDEIDSPREIPIDELRKLEYEHQLKSELYDTVNDELHSRNPAKDVLKKDTEVKPPKKEKATKSAKAKEAKADVKVEASEKPMTKAAQVRAKKEAAKQRLDVLLESVKEKQAAYDGGDANALKELVSLEKETKQAYRDAGMSRADEYKEAKKLFDKHDRALKRLENKGTKPAAETLKTKAENTDVLETYKKNQKASIEQAKAEEQSTVDIGNKTYSAVDESPFDEASTRTTREKPKFTSKEEASKGATAKNKDKIKEAKGKAKKQEQKFRRNPLPRGEALHKGTVKEVTGKELDEAINPPSFDDYIKAKKTYAKGQASHETEVVSRAGTSLTNATTAEAQREFLENGWRDGMFNYRRIKNKEKYSEVMKRFVDEPDAVSREIIRYNNDLSTLSADKVVDTHYQAHCVMKMLRKELDNPALTAEEKTAVKELYSNAASLSQKLSSMSGQVNQFQGVMVGCSPARRADNAIDNIVNILDSSKGFRKKQKIEIDGKTVALSDKMPERRQQIRALILENEDIAKDLKKVYDATTAEEYGEAMSELMLSTYKLNHATGFDYLQQWRYLAMLGNPKTHLRNLIGNTTFGALRQASNAIRSVEEKALGGYAAKKGLEIDYHGGLSFSAPMQARSRKLAKDEASKAAWDSFDKHKNEILGQNKYDTPEMAQFFGVLSKGNTKLLGWEDDIFRAPAYREQYIKSYRKFASKGEITDAILDRIHNEAVKESRIATFNEFNELAQILAKSQRGLYDYNASTGQKAVAHLSNALLPFTKVPANILKQSVNYSPAGVAKAVAHIKDAASRGDSELFNTALDELASGITGTGIAALGYFFGKNTDIFTTNAGSEDAAAKFKKQQGVQNYSATVDVDGKTYSFTLDWMVPASCTFFTGVELAKQLEKGASGSSLWDSIGNISQVTSRVIDPVLETSMLSGIYNIVENSRKSSSYDDQKSFADIALREIVQSYVSSYIPTLQGQLARSFAYDADKMVVGESDWDYFVNSLKVKMGLADVDTLRWDALGDDVNAYGEVKNKKTSASDYAKSFVKNAILPTNIQEVNLTDVDKQKIKEYEDYVAAGGDPADKEYLFPKKSYKTKFSYGKKGADPVDVKLSNKEVSLYNQAKTTGGGEGMRIVLEGTMFNRYEKDASGKRSVLKDGYTKEEKEKLIAKFEGKSMREVEQWLYKQPQFKNATEEEQRRTLNKLWSYSTQGTANGAKRVGEQAVVKSQGGDVNEYNFKNELSQKKQLNIKSAIDDGIVTYEEVVDFARNAGKTYYYENDEGGTSSTYYNKKQMLEYLEAKGYSHDKAEALFNAFKNSNAKPYGAASGRRGWGGWHRWGRHGGGGSKKTKIKTGSFKPATVHPSKGSSSASKLPKTSVNVKSTASAGSRSSSARSAGARSGSGSTKVSVPTTSSRRSTARVSTNVKRSGSRVSSNPKIAVTPLNIKKVKASTSKAAKKTNLSVALKDIENTQKKVAPPKARRK